MRARWVVSAVVLVGLVALPGGHAGARTRLSSVVSWCDALDRGAADLVRAIERSDDFDRGRDNLVIADLTAFRVYARSLREVAEEARGGWVRGRPPVRYRTSLGKMRQQVLRLRVTAANVESEITVERPTMANTWNRLMRSSLDPLVQMVLSLRVVARPPPPPPPPPDPGGRPPAGFVRVAAKQTYQAPAALKGRASAIRIEAYGGNLKIKSVKFTITEMAFGYFEIDHERTIRVNQDVRPGRPMAVQVDRGNVQDISKIEVEWEPDRRQRCFGRVTLTE